MQTTKEMRQRIRELAAPQSDDFGRAVCMLLDDFEMPQWFALGDGRMVQFNPAGRFHGWIFRPHPDGQWVSERKLDPIPIAGSGSLGSASPGLRPAGREG